MIGVWKIRNGNCGKRLLRLSKRLFRNVNGAGRVFVLQRIVKRDDVAFAGLEDFVERGEERFFGRVVGPKRKNSAGMDFLAQLAEAIGRIKRGVTFV